MSRHVPFRRLHNFRDAGGHRTSDGRTVRLRTLWRSDSLGKLSADPPGSADPDGDWQRFLSLGVRTVIDLRYPREVEEKGRVPAHPSLTYLNLSVEHRPYDQEAQGPEVEIGPYLAERFLEVAEDGVGELRTLLTTLRTGEGPFVVHCAAGKDRTGLVTALVLALLDVPEDRIVDDFARTGLATGRLLADWRAEHPGREPCWPGYGRAPGEVMARFLAGLSRRYGSARGYAEQRLGVTEEHRAALRSRFLEPVQLVAGAGPKAP
ncbi:tyrosine-protein phosphatase [Streptomyces sp. NPDC049906]|uniref:tyrosine-protein phosphatase n=1 Tax=Streptomyces sp. NPDC049906 TaxID=3155656 RepID=UPI00341636AE